MKFHVENRILADRDAVQAAYLDPAFYSAMVDMPKISPPEVVGREEQGDVILMKVRYRFSGDLPPAARRVLDPDKLTWVNESTVDLAEHRTEFRMVPDNYGNRIRFGGTYRFEQVDAATVQVIEGDLVVRYPIVGPLVERAILSGMREHLEQEAAFLEQWTASTR
ncbi:MAG TPA: DUF2505 domain-containing protein [Acidimicrobiales bacterium]|nr:DUF2505 domain-containing protein [Acidimicrobiales bacterium]